MLALSLTPNEYITINGNIVVTVSRLHRDRCYLAIHADKSIPIVRGTVLERQGGQRPACLDLPRNFDNPDDNPDNPNEG